MAAPAGAVVKLYVDTRWSIERGDVIKTQSGRRYLVESVRIQERGKHAGRKHLVVIVMAQDDPTPEDANVIPIRWYRR
ncbi:hypothetical protein SEA_FUZZBUSTER_54 [Microbacterium phage FuzzBuster]|uniref:Uncharacterized protein n=1 Tax=Microbacterium phage FuzzBuster TaxID=2590935 RepID=A0A516KV30_9CAUD|nr:hypothetical protein SEA_FUZZBUSTER_54 [Microbacterium phage FuzzBuster]